MFNILKFYIIAIASLSFSVYLATGIAIVFEFQLLWFPTKDTLKLIYEHAFTIYALTSFAKKLLKLLNT